MSETNSNTSTRMENMMAQVGAYWNMGSMVGKALGLVALVVGGSVLTNKMTTAPAPSATPPMGTQAVGYTLPQGAPQLAASLPPVSSQVTATFTVASVGKNKAGTSAYLNSRPTYKDPTNQTIELTGAAAATPVDSLKGRTVTATGTPGRNNNVVISDISSLRIQ